jgi:hypothetical protein
MIPDPHDGEPTAEVEPGLWQSFREAKIALEAAQRRVEDLKNEIILQIGDAYAGTVDGRKVATFRPKNQYAEAALTKAYPDLAQHFMRTKRIQVLDLPAFLMHHPDIVSQYQVRAFRIET